MTERFKLKVSDVTVFTNLEVKLKSRTTKEEANKEVERILDAENVFDGYDWKIEECENGGIKDLNADLQEAIKARLGEEEPGDSIFWDGMKVQFDLNVAHVPVLTDLEVTLKAQTKEAAVQEAAALRDADDPFAGYSWKIAGCAEDGINALDADLKQRIQDRLKAMGSIEEGIVSVS